MAGRFSVSAVFKAVDSMTGPVRRMQRGVGRFSRSAEMSLRRVDRMAGGVSRSMGIMGAAAVGASYGFQRLVSGTTQGAEEVLKFSNRLGVGVQWMQRWQGVARRFGVQNEAMQDGLKELQMRVDEAVKTGKGPAVESLQRLGFSREELEAAGGDAQTLFNMVRKEIQGIDNFAKRQRIVDELFGGQGGEQMVEMLGASEEQIRKIQGRVDESDTLFTRNELQRIRQFNRGVTDSGEMLRGVKKSIVLDMLPALRGLNNRFRGWLQANREAITSGIGDFLSYIANNLETILTWTKRLFIAVAAWWAFSAAVKAATTVMTAFNIVMAMNPAVLITIAVLGLIAAIVGLVYWIYNAADWMKIFGKAGEYATWLISKGAELLGKAADWVRKKWGEFKDWWDGLWTDIEDLAGGVMDKIEKWIGPVLEKMRELVQSARSAAGWLGIGGDDEDSDDGSNLPRHRGAGMGMVSPQERTASEMSSRYEEQNSTVTIRDETGRAEMSPVRRGGFGVRMYRSGEP